MWRLRTQKPGSCNEKAVPEFQHCEVRMGWGTQRAHLTLNLYLNPAKKTQSVTCQMRVPCSSWGRRMEKMVTKLSSAYNNCLFLCTSRLSGKVRRDPSWGSNCSFFIILFNMLGLQQCTGDPQALINRTQIWKVLKGTLTKKVGTNLSGRRASSELKWDYLQ